MRPCHCGTSSSFQVQVQTEGIHIASKAGNFRRNMKLARISSKRNRFDIQYLNFTRTTSISMFMAKTQWTFEYHWGNWGMGWAQKLVEITCNLRYVVCNRCAFFRPHGIAKLHASAPKGKGLLDKRYTKSVSLARITGTDNIVYSGIAHACHRVDRLG